MINSELKDIFKQTPRNLTGYVVRTTKDNTNYVYHDASNNLISAKVERTAPSGKFFGYAVGQTLTVELLTKEVDTSSNRMRLVVKDKDDGNNIYSSYFFLNSVTYDETATRATLVGSDLIAGSSSHTLSEVGITYPISLYQFAKKVVEFLGGELVADFTGVNPNLTTANFEGSENLHTVLAAIAEATGTICYCSTGSQIVFKNLLNSTIVDSFGPEFYFEFKTQEPITLTQIISVTELGDNYKSGKDGYAQVLRENPFLVLREDITALLDAIATKVIGLTLCPYTIKHRGNPCYEPGDYIVITNLDGEVKNVYYGNESFTFNGGFVATSEWTAEQQENPDATPAGIGAAIKQTYAKVDKANKKIELVAGEVSQLTLDTEGMLASVEQTISNAESLMEVTNESIDALTKRVQTSMTAENASILIQQELTKGVTTVKTTTGYVFDDEGLTISKTGSEMTTQITEDGMTVYKDGQAMLAANNQGVDAVNLHATTYLLIGNNSRLEDWQGRTACFWIGN